MVNPERQRSRYVAGTEGAPPLPPPGGYRGARRTQPWPLDDPAAAGRAKNDAAEHAIGGTHPEKEPANAVGWIALVGGILFAIVLLSTLLVGGTDALYSVTMLTVQLLILGVAIAAVVTRRGRVLGASALTIALLLNVATVGAMSAVQTSASGNYDGQKTEEQKHQEAYPGIKGVSESDILSQDTLETVRNEATATMEAVRTELSARYGYTWTQIAEEKLRPERNGYGGESMLVAFTSATWATNEPITDYDRKLEVMQTINEVISAHGLWGLYALNDPSSMIDTTVLQKMYGSSDPRTQSVWEWYADNYPDPLRFYAVMNDLTNDTTGVFRTEREADQARTGEPLEGLQLSVLAPQLLSEADRPEFQQRISEY